MLGVAFAAGEVAGLFSDNEVGASGGVVSTSYEYATLAVEQEDLFPIGSVDVA